MSLFKPDLVLFDLDGTLVDSVPDIAFSVNAMLSLLEIPERPEQDVRHWIGNGLERLIKRALTNDMHGEPDIDLLDRARPLFMEIYAENACRKTRLYDGVENGLAWLKNNNFKLGCVTNKKAQFTHTILQTLGVHDDFGIVISGDTLARKKPDPLPLLHAAEYFSARPNHSLMVGDSKNDVQAARAAGFQVCCVSYGYNHGFNISDAGPDAVIASLSELPGLLNT